MIRDRSEELYAFHARHFAERVSERPTSANGHHSELTDEEVIRLARSAKNAAKFEALQSGDTRGYASHSEADQAYISLLAFYTQDEEQLDRLYRQSGLCREKWINRPGYRRSTIEKALSNLTETYTPDDGARMIVGNGSKIDSSAPREGVADERILKFKTAKELSEETPAVTEWIAHPWVAKGAITEVDGKIKAGGKTIWISHMAACILEGRPFMEAPTIKMSAVFLTEQQPASFRRVLERAGLTESENLYILPWHSTRGMPWLDVARAAVDKALEVGAGVLFVDTLGQFAGIRGDGENNAGAAQEGYEALTGGCG